jgi:hypothetical protein
MPHMKQRLYILATVIAGVSAIVATIGAAMARKSAGAAMKSTCAATMGAQKQYDGTLLPAVTNIGNQRIDWAKNSIGAIDTPFGTLLTILFSIALGVGLNLLLSRSDSPGALVRASQPAVPAVSAPTPPTSTAAAPASAASASRPPPTPTREAPASAASASRPPPTPTREALASPTSASSPPPTSIAAASDHSEIVGLLAHGRAYLSDGDIASARVFFRRAAERGDPQAAFALGATYDPAELRRLGIPNLQSQADPAKAQEWYRTAADLGSAAAASRLDQLPKTDR